MTPGNNTAIELTDQLGQGVNLSHPARRIVSLVPSITLTLFDLGLEDRLCGRTKFCVHPKDKVGNIEVVGGTKQFHPERIRRLQPDLIIANKEENEEPAILELKEHFPVYISDVKNMEDNYAMIADIGSLTGTREVAGRMNGKVKQAFDNLPHFHGMRTAYFIWRDPYMTAGNDTFIDHILSLLGLENVFKFCEGRYPEVREDEISRASARLILLSSEPYPFKEQHIREFEALCPEAEVITVDGEYFSWYGSRMEKAPEYFNSLFDRVMSDRQ